MPPQLSHSQSLITPRTPLLSPKSRYKQILHQRYCQEGGRRMKLTKRKLIPLLVFILCSGASIFRFLNISMITSTSAPLPAAALPPIHQHPKAPSKARSKPMDASGPTEKEIVPCNLLVFGLEYQYSRIASLNAGGVTIFLEDNLQNTSTIQRTNNTQVHRIMYDTLASEAYQLLRVARENPECLPKFHLSKTSKCKLALPNLPRQVYDIMWDVVMVDGPSGDTPDSPGRMASIYTASMLARKGNMTHVMVHDVDRMIEKWYSWEFLCEENLVSSKGRFWHFQMPGVTYATTFCTR
ncbi:hypothetical protein CDL12_04814 [Handroanthus impetiginosus]|uniref:Uncharacterized protein n=1 Tax=Handroanthus impetiginosus TaxID=429701 RepID=A0A2G9HY68_9LAMI|nr:hypothetical protein CDL12_04814 [Handroanthus impetiginosus]